MNPFSRLFFLSTCFLFFLCSPASAAPVPDTNQTLCYDDAGNEIDCAGSGQDGSESINPMSYEKLDDEGYVLSPEATTWVAVRDKVTGLVWEVKNEANKDVKYCWGSKPSDSSKLFIDDFLETLNTEQYAGRNDWRIPTIKELTSLVRYIDNPEDVLKIDTDYFPNTAPDGSYWSATPFEIAEGMSFSYSLNFKAFTQHANWNNSSFPKSYLRAVSGPKQTGEYRLKPNHEIPGTVTDTETGLMWEQELASKYLQDDIPIKYTWGEALAYCNTLETGGYRDWRLPTAKELLTIVNFAGSKKLVYPSVFSNIRTESDESYWTSTYAKHESNESPLTVHFSTIMESLKYYSDMAKAAKSTTSVLAVRGGQPIKDGHLVITSPRQGADIEPGEEFLVKWIGFHQATQGNVLIDFSTDGGKHFTTVTGSAENTGVYAWQIPPDISSVNCMLRITPTIAGHEQEGTSQGLFRIGPQVKLLLGDPSGHTSESGLTATIPVCLNTQPDGTVVLSIESDNHLEGIVSQGDTLTFGPDDYAQAQLVTLTGTNDHVVDGSVAYHALATVDQVRTTDTTGYTTLEPTLITLINDDNDTADFVVTPDKIVISEDGTSANISVHLTSKPTGNVTIQFKSIHSHKYELNKAELVFSPTNWGLPQKMVVTGKKDGFPKVDEQFDLSVEVDIDKTTDQSGYKAIESKSVHVTCLNTDPGLFVTDYWTEGYNHLRLTEDGGTAQFSVRLLTQPSANVTVDIESTDTTEGVVSPQQLVFTPLNWGDDQFVTATGVDDFIIEDPMVPEEFQIIIRPNKSETKDTTGYTDAPERIIYDVKNVDNNDWERIALTVGNISGTVTENGGSATFHVALATVPDGDVIVDVTSSNEAEASVSPATLVFAPETWNDKKTVTVTGVPDSKEDGEKEVTVQLSVNGASSDTTGYKDTAATKVPFKSSDAPSSSDNVSKSPEAQGQDTGGGCFIQSLHHGLP